MYFKYYKIESERMVLRRVDFTVYSYHTYCQHISSIIVDHWVHPRNFLLPSWIELLTPWFKHSCMYKIIYIYVTSGNLLLHQPSNSNYCVSLRQLAVPWPLWSGQQPAGQKLVAPGGYFYSGICPDHNGQGNRYKTIVQSVLELFFKYLLILLEFQTRIRIPDPDPDADPDS